MSVERQDIIDLRESQNLTIDEIHERYPQIPRSRIGRWVKGIKIDRQNREVSKEVETNTSEILEDEPENPLETSSNVEPLQEESNILHPESQNPQKDPAKAEREVSPNAILTSLSPSQPPQVQNPMQRESFSNFYDLTTPGHLAVPESFLDDLEKCFSTPAQTRIMRGWRQNLRQYNTNLAKDRANRNNGHGLSSGFGSSELDHELALSVKASRQERMYRMAIGEGQQNKDDSFKDKLLLQLMTERNKVQPQQNSLKDALSSMIQLQTSQSKSNWDFFGQIQSQINSLRPSSNDPKTAVELKKLDLQMRKWEIEQKEGAKKMEMVAAIIGGAVGKLPEVIGGIRGNPGNPNSEKAGEISKFKCPKCGVIFPVKTQDMLDLKPIHCSVCGATLTPEKTLKDKLIKEVEKHEKTQD